VGPTKGGGGNISGIGGSGSGSGINDNGSGGRCWCQ